MAAKPKVDLTEFFKLSRPKKRPCAVAFAASQLETDEERDQLTAALETDQGIITSGAVQQWLAGRKQDVTVSAVVSHRKRTCTCADD